MAFMNHSCRPTAVVQASALDVRAAVDLKEGGRDYFILPFYGMGHGSPFQVPLWCTKVHRHCCWRTISVDPYPQALFYQLSHSKHWWLMRSSG